MAYGQYNESVARTLFIEKLQKAVRPAGLFIDEEFGFLGASPDGVIEKEKSLLEIKCFPSLARSNQDIFSAAKSRKNFPLYVDDGGSLQITKSTTSIIRSRANCGFVKCKNVTSSDIFLQHMI
ncbi:uncharacterized protein isoform X1 [Choristoneura fumiferana]|uniref:uncharacterized protein isoform X1 n=1 Tax=Choristoneura fumiferana TaxID=7141 RepID=UPI003D15D953